jgi:hypothetical protein
MAPPSPIAAAGAAAGAAARVQQVLGLRRSVQQLDAAERALDHALGSAAQAEEEGLERLLGALPSDRMAQWTGQTGSVCPSAPLAPRGPERRLPPGAEFSPQRLEARRGRGSERLSVRGRTSLSIQLSGRSLNLGFGGGSLKSDKALQPSRPSAPGHVLLGAGGNGSKECSRDRISGASIPIGSAGLAVVSSSARAWSVIPARAFARHLCAGSTECRTCDTRGLPGGMRSREPCGQVGRH